MNLYIINESSQGTVYGIGTYIRELLEALRHSRIKICVIYLKSNKLQIEEKDDIKYWHFPILKSEQRTVEYQKRNELYYKNVVYLLQSCIEDKKNLIFHLNYNQTGKLAEALKKTFDCRIVTTVHYLEWCFSLLGNLTRFRKILTAPETYRNDKLRKTVEESYRNEKAFFKTVNHILCLSENTREILHDDYKISSDKLSIIYNGLDDKNTDSDKKILRNKYHIPDIPVILFAGRLDDTKGLIFVLRAFKKVLSKYSRCHIIIAGNGEFNIHMKECEDIWMYVTWTGLISKDKLYELYSVADIGVMPSFHEQCSYVAIEMMMHGLPIIGSTSTGLKEMITDGETGLHIPVIECDDKVEIDTDLLAEKMLFLLHNPKERQRMGQNSRKRYEELYSTDVFRKNMLNFYYSLCK